MHPNRDIDLGLAVSGALLGPGERRTHDELAAFAGCSRALIYLIERDALKKIRTALMRQKNRRLREELEEVLRPPVRPVPAGIPADRYCY